MMRMRIAATAPAKSAPAGECSAIKSGAFMLLFASFCVQGFAAADDAARYSAGHGERALLVWQNGRLLMERYREGGSQAKTENVYSITKSLCALGTFTAISRNVLKLDEPVSLTLTEWRNDSRKRRITVRDLLNQTSGLSPGFREIYTANLLNKEKAALELPIVSTPGEAFAYGPSHYEALEVLMARKLDRSPLTWIASALFNPLGIKPGGWRRDRVGNPYFSAGAQLSARDLLAAGQVVRREGWNRISSRVPSSLIRTAALGSAANPMYGLGFWLNRCAPEKDAVECDVEEAISSRRPAWARSCLSKRAPADLIAMVGSHGQRVYISASQDLIIVRLGRGTGFRDPDFLRAFFR
ncbi:MAG TPA: serine hydrolase domain-containing protein [Terrimicrobiaceae bacterium]